MIATNKTYSYNKKHNQEYLDKALTKGNYAEEIIRDYLSQFGDVYTHQNNKAIQFDGFFLYDSYGASVPVIYDVKAKPSMSFYIATGFDLQNYNSYVEFQNKNPNLTVNIYFVDSKLKWCYFASIKELSTPYYDDKEKVNYPKVIDKSKTIIFSLKKMHRLFKLTPMQIEKLKKTSQQNEKYI